MGSLAGSSARSAKARGVDGTQKRVRLGRRYSEQTGFAMHCESRTSREKPQRRSDLHRSFCSERDEAGNGRHYKRMRRQAAPTDQHGLDAILAVGNPNHATSSQDGYGTQKRVRSKCTDTCRYTTHPREREGATFSASDSFRRRCHRTRAQGPTSQGRACHNRRSEAGCTHPHARALVNEGARGLLPPRSIQRSSQIWTIGRT
eukprot:5233005-Pleurochrysis_carterae.AAC.1